METAAEILQSRGITHGFTPVSPKKKASGCTLITVKVVGSLLGALSRYIF